MSADERIERACEIAVQAGDKLTMSDALRHLGIAEHAAGRPDKARERLEKSVRIRTQLAAGSPLPHHESTCMRSSARPGAP
jgi:Tfp pilus assembly protein PilF